MAITELVSVEEYLHSTFEHDAEYLEGRIVARSAPEKPHSKTQGYVCRTLHQVAHPLGYEVWVEQRIHTQPAPARYRVPDLCVTQGEPPEFIAQGDRVVVVGFATGRIKATNKTFEDHWV